MVIAPVGNVQCTNMAIVLNIQEKRQKGGGVKFKAGAVGIRIQLLIGESVASA